MQFPSLPLVPLVPLLPFCPGWPLRFLNANANDGAAVVPPLVTVTDGVPTFASTEAVADTLGVAPVLPVSPFGP